MTLSNGQVVHTPQSKQSQVTDRKENKTRRNLQLLASDDDGDDDTVAPTSTIPGRSSSSGTSGGGGGSGSGSGSGSGGGRAGDEIEDGDGL
jgi:uncharacterized membrane protein YgcG